MIGFGTLGFSVLDIEFSDSGAFLDFNFENIPVGGVVGVEFEEPFGFVFDVT